MLIEDKRSRSALDYYCQLVARMKPGECLDIYREDLRDIATHWHNDAHFTAPDRILGNIMGSAYTHSFELSACGRKVTFMRHEDTGARRYKEPDHDIRSKRMARNDRDD